MTEEMGLQSFRKKRTERPENIKPEIADETTRTMPDSLLKLPERRLATKELSKSVRLPLNTHTAISTIAMLQSKSNYEVVNEMVEKYIKDLPLDEKKMIETNIETIGKKR